MRSAQICQEVAGSQAALCIDTAFSVNDYEGSEISFNARTDSNLNLADPLRISVGRQTSLKLGTKL